MKHKVYPFRFRFLDTGNHHTIIATSYDAAISVITELYGRNNVVFSPYYRDCPEYKRRKELYNNLPDNI